MKKLMTTLAVVSAAAICAGCSNLTQTVSAQPALPSLNGTSWMMVLDKSSRCETPPVIEFSEGRASGDLGCNNFMAVTKISGESIRFDQVASTMKLCAPDFMKLEETMKKVLLDTRSMKRTDKTLILLDENGRELIRLVPEKMGAC